MTTERRARPTKQKTPKSSTNGRQGSGGSAALKFAIEAARMLHDDKCEDVVVLDVRQVSPVSEYIVIGSGSSERQMRSVLSHVEDLGQEQGYAVFHSSKDDRATWLLADFVHVVVHVFEPNTRAHYDLEMLWGDAARVAWERPAKARAKRVAT